MKYKNPANGAILDMGQIEQLAAQQDPPISAFDYIDKLGLQAFIEPDVNFQMDTAPNQGASVVSNPGAPESMDSDSVLSSLEQSYRIKKAKVEKPLQDAIESYESADEDFEFQGGATGYVKSLRYDKIKEEERKLRNAEYTLYNPASFLDEEPKEVLKYLQKELSSTGIGFKLDGSTIYADVNGEILALPLTGDRTLSASGTNEYTDSAWTTFWNEEDRDVFNENFELILNYDRKGRAALAELNYDTTITDFIEGEIGLNTITTGLEEGEISSFDFNETLKGTEYYIKPILESGDDDSNAISGYDLYYGDQVVAQYKLNDLYSVTDVEDGKRVYQADAIEKYLKENMTADELNVLRKNMFKGFAAWNQNDKKIRNEVRNGKKKPSLQEVQARFIKRDPFNLFKNTLYEVLKAIPVSVDEAGNKVSLFDDQEIKILQDHFIDNEKKYSSLFSYYEQPIAPLFPDLGRQGDGLMPLNKFNIYTSLDGLPEEIKEKLESTYRTPSGDFSYENLVKEFQNKALNQLIVEKENTLLEQLTQQKEMIFTDSEGETSTVSVNQFLVSGAALMENSSNEIKKDNLDAFKTVVENTYEEVDKIVQQGAKGIIQDINNNKLPVSLNYTVNDDKNLIFNLQPTQELTEEQQDIFDNTRVDLLEWQQTVHDLNQDRELALANYVNTIVSLTETDYKEIEQLNKDKEGFIESLMKTTDSETGENYTEEKAKKIADKIKNRNSINVFDFAYKEYDIGSLMANDFYQASKGIFLAVPTILGSEFAIDEQRQINKNKELYETMLTYDDEEGVGYKYVLRTLSQQFPNIVLAIGTGGIGAYSGLLSSSAVKWSIAGTFGVTSGSDKYRNLILQTELADVANDQIDWLVDAKEKGTIGDLEYARAMADANQTLAMNEMSTSQIIGSSLMTGTIEGLVTRWIGTSNNTMKFLDDVAGGTSINMVNLVKNSSWKNRGLFGLEYIKRTGAEVVEEGIIYTGTQTLSESLILNKEFDISQLDDIALSTIITAGTSNTSVAYSALVNVSLAEDIRKEAGTNAQQIVTLINNLKDPKLKLSARKQLIAKLAQFGIDQKHLMDQAGVDVLALGEDNIRDLLAFNTIKESLLDQAGYVQGSGKNPNRVIGQYKRKLKPTQKEAFEKQLNDVESSINNIKNKTSKNYKGVIDALNAGKKNGLYNHTVRRLENENDSDWSKAKTPRQKIAVVMDKIRQKISQENTEKAYKNKNLQLLWTKIEAKQKNEKNKVKKEEWFEMMGQTLAARGINTTIITKESQKAENLIVNFDNYQLVNNKEDLFIELDNMLDNKEITVEDYLDLQKNLDKKDVNGFVINNKYVFINKADAEKRFVENGDISAGTVIVHEMNHLVDDAFFGNTYSKDGEVVLSKRGKEYVDNLFLYMKNSTDSRLMQIQEEALAQTVASVLGVEVGPKGFDGDFNTLSARFKDEYSKEVQTRLFAAESIGDINYEQEEKFNFVARKLNDWFGLGERMSTPEASFEYAVANNEAARRGELRQIVRRTIAKQKAKPKTKGVKKSVSSPISKLASNFNNLDSKEQEEFNKQYMSVGVAALKRWAVKKGVPSTAIDQAIKNDPSLLMDVLPYAIRRYKPINSATGKTQEFSTFLDSFLGRRIGTKIVKEYTDKIQTQREGDLTEQGKEIVDKSKPGDLKQRAEKESTENIPSIKENIKTKNKKSLVDNITKGVEQEVKYKLPKIGGNQTVKSKSNLVRSLNKGLLTTKIKGKNLYATVIDEIGGRNKTLPEFEQFLSENYGVLLSPGGLTTTYLSKAFPQAVQKYVNGMGWVNYDVWKGRTKGTKPGQIDFYRTGEGPYQGSTSGMQKIRRVPNIKNVISPAQFKGKYIDGINNKVKVAPTEALAKQLVQEIGIEIFSEEIQKDKSPIKDQFVNRQELLNQLADVYNLEAEVGLETERRGIKNSLSTLSPDTFDTWLSKKDKFFNDILGLPLEKRGDDKAILRIHKNIYGSTLTEDEHKNIARQFSRLLVPITKADIKILGNKKTVRQYLEDIVLAGDVNQTIVEFTGASRINEEGDVVPFSIAEMIRDKDMILEGRQFVSDVVVPALIKKYGKTKALNMIVAYMKTTFSQGQSKFGAFKIENGEIVEHKEKNNRVSLFGRVNTDVLQNIIQKNFSDVVSIDNMVIKFTNGKERKVDINTSADVSQGMIDDKINVANQKKDAKLAREFTEAIIDALPAKGENNNLTALILATLNASSNSSLRLAAPVWGRTTVMPYAKVKRTKRNAEGEIELTPLGKPKKETNYRYEHAIPARVVLWYLYDSKINNNKNIDLDLLFDDYRVTIIPVKEVDDVLRDTGFSSIMLASYIPGDQTWWKRYFNRFTKGKIPYALQSYETGDIIGKDFQDYYEKKNPPIIKSNSENQVAKDNNADIAMRNARNSTKYSKSRKKIRVFDFDDTLAKTNSKVIVIAADGSRSRINATEFARDGAKLQRQGAIFDFTEFNKVIDGKKGPLFKVAKTIQDKRGSEDIFILTARPQEAALPIQQFLASIGLNIPIENITGLEDGRPQAKADWIINKFAEGYNDFYFTDDAYKNVKAVKAALDVLDVKSKVQQARVKFSQSISREFNEMIERNKGVKADARYSQVVAQRLGRNKKKYQFFVPPSAEDFRGLTSYMFAGKGKQGEADQAWFEKTLVLPYTRGVAAIEKAKQQVSNDYRALMIGYPKIRRVLRRKIKGEEFTYDEAVRVYLWDQAGYTIPGISKRDQAKLVKVVLEDPNLMSFADSVKAITKQEMYVEPTDHWNAMTILSDLNSLTNDINRKEYLSEFIENSEQIFSEENLNKIEALYGTRVKEALVDILYRMKTGVNKREGADRIVNRWNQWVNNSVGAIMFLNRRSALLQLISNINFINWSDNNPIKAAQAFANQKQYWKDVVYIFNSDKLKQRRSGLKGDINEAEIAAAVKGAKDPMTAFISVLLKYGFTFTQIADSVAIATGGATFYRNRINTYANDGMAKAEAESKAFEDFSLISDEAQQSADPMMISKQQAGVLGRIILAFQNTPMQYTRLMKKAGLDLINGRGDAKTHISKIIYYGAIQNFIFSALSNALFTLVPGFEDPDEDLTEEEQIEKYGQVITTKQQRILNNMMDTILRGSGLAGAVVSSIKNALIRYNNEEKKGFTADHTYTLLELISVSPPIGSKAKKVYGSIQTKRFERDVIAERGYDVTIDGKFNLSPSYSVAGDLVSGFTNFPLDRMVAEVQAITEALDNRNTDWQRLALWLGWRSWDVNAKNEEHDLIKAEAKERRKIEGIEKGKKTRAENKRKEYEKYLEGLSPEEYLKEIEQQKELEKIFEQIDFDEIFDQIEF